MSHTHNIVDSGSHFVIDPLMRTITAVAEKVVLVEGDHNSERYTFEIPRMVEGHDMSLTDRIEIHYDNISRDKSETIEGLYIVNDIAVNGDTLEFSWLITENVTKLAGTTQFWINFICLDSNDNIIYSWGTEIFKSIKILQNNDNTESVIAKFPDVLTQWKEEVLDSIEASGESYITFVESPDEDECMLCLRDLESGMYILSGRFKPFSSATSTYTFSNNMLASVIRNDDISYIQILYSKDNTLQYLEITDDSVFRKDAKLVNMQSVANLTTVVDETSDDEHYPSAKAVYELIDNLKDDIPSGEISAEDVKQAVEEYLEENPIDGTDNIVDF